MNLKEKKYLLLDLDGVCYGKHNNYSLERVFGQVSKRMTQFISEKLKIDRDKAKELYRDFYDYTSYNNRYLDLHGAANKIISYLESDWEAHGSYGKYCQGVEQTEENQRYMFYQYTDFMDSVRGHNFFETFPQFEELKEEYKEILKWNLKTPNWWVDDE